MHVYILYTLMSNKYRYIKCQIDCMIIHLITLAEDEMEASSKLIPITNIGI